MIDFGVGKYNLIEVDKFHKVIPKCSIYVF